MSYMVEENSLLTTDEDHQDHKSMKYFELSSSPRLIIIASFFFSVQIPNLASRASLGFLPEFMAVQKGFKEIGNPHIP